MFKMASNFQIKFLVFIVLFVHSSLGLKCYICNSAKDPSCSSTPPPEKFLLECSQDTLEILNDMHRQTKMTEAANLAAEKKNADDDNEAGERGIDASSPQTSASIPFDHHDKDLALNRTERGSEETIHADAKNNDNAPSIFSTHPIKLPKEATFCRKTSYHIPKQHNGPNMSTEATVRVIRACGWIPEEKKAGEPAKQSNCKWIGTEGVQMDQCVCTGDGCNSGNYLGSLKTQTLILVAVMAAGYFYVL